MIRLRQIKINIDKDNKLEITKKIAKKLRINESCVLDYKISKRSIDARKKDNIEYVYELDVKVNNEEKILKKISDVDVFKTPLDKYTYKVTGTKKLNSRPVVIGFGPAGMMCSYMLAKFGYKPLIIERGSMVDKRIADVEKFWNENILNSKSNVQFGEGGAGTFSDGKLNTLVKDKYYRQKFIFETFVENGAPEEILYDSHPHIGTDILRKMVKNIRNNIIKMGGDFKFDTTVTDIIVKNNELEALELNNSEIIKCDIAILAIGHSARDTFKMLNKNKIEMQNKPFAVGIRISHNQKDISYSQYKDNYKKLPPASYKLTYQTKNKRGVYSFCMCPGGYVVNSSSENEKLAINGMSNFKRESSNANSAIIVTVTEKDYGDALFSGLKFQEELESNAYKIGEGLIPVQLYKDYKDNVKSTGFKSVKPVFKGNYNFANINKIFPVYINESLTEAIEYFGTKIKNFNNDDAIIAAVESRTSSPVRIVRDDNLESNIKGIYPCGEGAGYAGGITSAAIDGIKVFEKIADKYNNL